MNETQDLAAQAGARAISSVLRLSDVAFGK